MKWFKHMSDLPRDEGVARYLDKAGNSNRLLAYGFLMFVFEAVALRMERGTSTCSVTYSITEWARVTYSHPNRVEKYLSMLRVVGWVQVECADSTWKVTIPKLLELLDEYSRKSGHTPDKVAQSREEKNRLDKRESRQESSLPDCLKAEGASRSPPPDFKITKVLQAWAEENHPSVPIDKETAKFRNYPIQKPCSDWDAQWKLWIQRASEYLENKNGLPSKASRDEQIVRLGKDLGVEKLPDESESQYFDRVDQINQRRIQDLN